VWVASLTETLNIGDGRMFKLPSGKRDYLLPDGEKHDYDW